MRFRNLSLAKKLMIGFGVVIGIVAVSSAVTVMQARQAAEIERLNDTSSAAVGDIDQVWGSLNAARFNMSRFVLTGNEDDKSKVQSSITDLTTYLASAKDIVSVDAPELLPVITDFQEKLDKLTLNFFTPELDLASHPESRPQARAMMLSAANDAAADDVGDAFRILRDKFSFWSDGWTEAGSKAMSQIKLVALISAIATILLGSAMAWIIVQAIRRPMVAMTAAMQRLAAGDNAITVPALDQRDEIGQMAATVQTFKEAALDKLRLEGEAGQARHAAEAERSGHEADRARAATLQAHVVDALAEGLAKLSQGNLVFRLNDRFAPEYEKLQADFNAAMDKLLDTIRTVSTNADTIRSGTSEISTASNDLSRRTEQQAASLEQTAAALNEITVTVRKTAEGAMHARKVVSAAKADAEHSGEVVRKAVQAMGAIEGSSRQISQIIGVIDEIAFQTNLLALNAGVEAARAGDAGRGFAVVASEVRSLAQRSAEAAKEIKALILSSGHEVSQGVSLVGETGEALTRIVTQVSEINAIVNGMAAAAHEQSTALGEINVAINQMDQMTQQNAAMVEQSTAASHSLSQETGRLAQLIGRFQTGQGSTAPKMGEKAPRAPLRTVPALKSVGRSGAAPRLETSAEGDSWDEF